VPAPDTPTIQPPGGSPSAAQGPSLPPGSPGGPPKVPPVIVQSTATYVPELGGSNASAEKDNVDRMATQIVSMMEVAW
jgi:hypothetical protein